MQKIGKDQAKKIWVQISAYRLAGGLYDRLQVVISGGVARTTMYKAFRLGGTTPLLNKILETAQAIVSDHENSIQDEEEKVVAI